jgi:hypothetical protein
MRRVTSVVLALSFILLAVTGLSMMLRHGPGAGHGPPSMAGEGRGLGPRGPAERGPQFRAAGPPGEHREPLFPSQLHELGALVMLVAGIVHIVLNWKALLSHVGVRRRLRAAPAP